MEQTAPNTPPAVEWTPRRVMIATLIVLGVAFAFWLLIRFRLVFFSLFIAIVLSTAIDPLIDRLGKLGVPRPVSIIITSVLILALVAVLIITVAPLITEQGATLTSLLSGWYEDFRKTMIESPSLMVRRLARQLPVFLSMNPTTTLPPTDPATAQPQMDVVQQAINFASTLFRELILLISVLLLTGLWIIEGDVATRFMLMAAPSAKRESIREFLNDMEKKVGAYTRGLALLALAIGVMAGIAYAIIGLPNVLLLAVIAGLMEIVPLVGPALGAIPALLVAASTDPSKVVLVLVVYTLIQFTENHFIVPRIMDRTVGVNPVASLLAFVAFGSIFGFAGALLAVPLAAVIQLVLNRFVFNVSPTDQSPPTGRDAISSLRYEAQNLVQDVRKQVREKETEVNAREDRIEDAMEAIAQDLDSVLAQMETKQNGKTRKGTS